MVSFLKVFLIVLWLWMAYVVISTSMESSLFKEWDFLGSIPWMRATLWDFYANILIVYLWVLWREHSIAVKILWAILFFCLGSLASIAYLLIQLFPIRNDTDLPKIFNRKSAVS